MIHKNKQKKQEKESDMSERISNIRPVLYRGRSHIACNRCKSLKSKCTGDKPTCDSCKATSVDCVYAFRDRKLIILESEYLLMQNRIKELEKALRTVETRSVNSSKINDLQSYLNGSLLMDQLPGYQKYSMKDDNFAPEASFFNLDLLPDIGSTRFLLNACFRTATDSHCFFEDDEVEIFQCLELLHSTNTITILQMARLLIFLALGELYLFNIHSNKLTQEELNLQLSDCKNGFPGLYYFNESCKLFNSNLENPSIYHAQTALLIGLYEMNLNRVISSSKWFELVASWGYSILNNNLDATEVDLSKWKQIWLASFALHPELMFKYSHENFDIITQDELQINQRLKYLRHEIDVLKFYLNLNDLINEDKQEILINSTLKLLLEMESLCNLDGQTGDILELMRSKKNTNQLNEPKKSWISLYLRQKQCIMSLSFPILNSIIEKKSSTTIKKSYNSIIQKAIDAASNTISVFYELKSSGILDCLSYYPAHYIFISTLALLRFKLEKENFSGVNDGLELLSFLLLRGNIVAQDRMRQLMLILDDHSSFHFDFKPVTSFLSGLSGDTTLQHSSDGSCCNSLTGKDSVSSLHSIAYDKNSIRELDHLANEPLSADMGSIYQDYLFSRWPIQESD